MRRHLSRRTATRSRVLLHETDRYIARCNNELAHRDERLLDTAKLSVGLLRLGKIGWCSVTGAARIRRAAVRLHDAVIARYPRGRARRAWLHRIIRARHALGVEVTREARARGLTWT